TEDPPAADLEVGDRFYLPVEWVERFAGDEPWAVGETTDHLLLWSRAGGFVIADYPLDGKRASEKIEEATAIYRERGIAAELESEFGDPPANLIKASVRANALQKWMAWTFPFLRHLLRLALGDDARDMLLRTGTIYCTATHVDLVMTMDEISLSARSAGLDVDPGWSPDLMRVVKFHFE